MKTKVGAVILTAALYFLEAFGCSPASDGACSAYPLVCYGKKSGADDAANCGHLSTSCPDGYTCALTDVYESTCQKVAVNLPSDAAPHSNDVEWWYYTGHLSDGVRKFGFEVTIFQADLGDEQMGYMCHVAVLDKNEKKHYHTDSIRVYPQIWESNPTDIKVDNCRFKLGGDGADYVYGAIPAGAEKGGAQGEWLVEINVTPKKKAVYHGGNGIISMSGGGNESYYYSYTRLTASGKVKTPEGEFAVEGQAWMDHQWGDFTINTFKGWDWWSVQLDNDYEIMLFQFRDWNNKLVYQSGTLVTPDENQILLLQTDYTIQSLRSWKSPNTDGTYPLDWNITINAAAKNAAGAASSRFGDKLTLSVAVETDDQEMPNMVQNYWEGEVIVAGTLNDEAVKGIGYVELTGYATDLFDPKNE